jgi:hypothetical protein
MKTGRLILVVLVAGALSACAGLPIVSGGASFSGKDAVKTINMIRNTSRITMPGIEEEISNGMKNVFGYHKNVH